MPGLLQNVLNYFGITGSTVKDTPGATVPSSANLRRLRCDDDGYLEVVAAAPLSSLIYGLGGDGTTENPFPQYGSGIPSRRRRRTSGR
jgi:hypothetical protein